MLWRSLTSSSQTKIWKTLILLGRKSKVSFPNWLPRKNKENRDTLCLWTLQACSWKVRKEKVRTRTGFRQSLCLMIRTSWISLWKETRTLDRRRLWTNSTFGLILMRLKTAESKDNKTMSTRLCRRSKRISNLLLKNSATKIEPKILLYCFSTC